MANGRSKATRNTSIRATPKIHCKVFEDNEGAIEIANVPKMRPRTKHLNIKYHHFCEVQGKDDGVVRSPTTWNRKHYHIK